jgi:HSP20 family protein
MGKVTDDKKPVVYRFQRSYHDLIRAAGEEKIHEPLVDIYETKDSLRIEIELPGVQRKDIEIYTIGDKLYVRAFKREDCPGGETAHKKEFLCLEREFGEYYREIEIMVPCDNSAGRAKISEGVLVIELPKLADRRGQRVNLPLE